MNHDAADNLQPSPDGSNGRQAGGRFAAGNSYGRGNPHARQTAALREALLSAVTPDDVLDVVRSLLEQAKLGNVQAARELLDRTCGRVPMPVPEEQPKHWQPCLCQLRAMYGPGAPVDDV